MLHTTTDGKNTSDRGTLPSKVVWTVAFRNSLVLLLKKNPPDTTDSITINVQKAERNAFSLLLFFRDIYKSLGFRIVFSSPLWLYRVVWHFSNVLVSWKFWWFFVSYTLSSYFLDRRKQHKHECNERPFLALIELFASWLLEKFPCLTSSPGPYSNWSITDVVAMPGIADDGDAMFDACKGLIASAVLLLGWLLREMYTSLLKTMLLFERKIATYILK